MSFLWSDFQGMQEKPEKKIMGRQLAAARALLGWTQRQLATAADVSIETIISWEGDVRHPRRETVQKVLLAIEEMGVVEFTNGGNPGVRYKTKDGDPKIDPSKH
jgi:transcriptional regulator with XRE-family HTH domain